LTECIHVRSVSYELSLRLKENCRRSQTDVGVPDVPGALCAVYSYLDRYFQAQILVNRR
jgi:hypothetical protein